MLLSQLKKIRVCIAHGCLNRHVANGLCRKHYLRQSRHGDINIVLAYGKKHSEEWKKNIADAHKGKKHTEETRGKISKALKGTLAGSKNHMWKGGITPLKNAIRRSFEYKTWRTSIFQRDNYTCLLCGRIGGELHVDHYPKSYAQILKDNNITCIEMAIECDELWDIKNNRTLCIVCHKSTFNYLNGKDTCF